MTRFMAIGAALVASAIALSPVSAQVSEPAAAAARDPNFSVYSSGPAGFRVQDSMAQALPEDAWTSQPPVRPHRAHRGIKR